MTTLLNTILWSISTFAIGFMAIYAVLSWLLIKKSLNRLSRGFIFDLANSFLLLVFTVILLCIWLLLLLPDQGESHLFEAMTYLFIVFTMTAMCIISYHIHKISEVFGFKEVGAAIAKRVKQGAALPKVEKKR